MKNIYINQVSSFLPNKPVGNEEMENYIGLMVESHQECVQSSSGKTELKRGITGWTSSIK